VNPYAYVDDVMVIKGHALWTSAFTPTLKTPLYNPYGRQDPYADAVFVYNAGGVVTSGVIFDDMSNSYALASILGGANITPPSFTSAATLGGKNAIAMNKGYMALNPTNVFALAPFPNFTFECYWQPASGSVNHIIVESRTNTGSSAGFVVYADATHIFFYVREVTICVGTINMAAMYGSMHHIAIDFASSNMTSWTVTIYIDGVSVASGNLGTSTYIAGTDKAYLANDDYGDTAPDIFGGFRLSTARLYNGNFTPSYNVFPTFEVKKTRLRLRFNGNFTDESLAHRTPASLGTAAIVAWNGSNSPSATSLGSFGATQGLEYAKTSDMIIGTQQATIKFSIFKTAITSDANVDALVGDWISGTGVANRWSLAVNQSHQLVLKVGTTSVTSGSGLPFSAWARVVLCFNGDNAWVFVNGVLFLSATFTGRNLSDTLYSLYVGSDATAVNGADALMDRFELSIGVARYSNTNLPSKWV
jgi:hypothetical protein